MFGRKAAKRAREQERAHEALMNDYRREYAAETRRFTIALDPNGWSVSRLAPPFWPLLGAPFPMRKVPFSGPFASKTKAEAWLRDYAKGPRHYDKNGKALTK